MTRSSRALALMLALGLAAGTVAGLDAKAEPQVPKKDDKKPAAPKADDKKGEKATAALGKIEIYKGKKGFRWRIVDANDKTVAMPTANLAWETKEEVEKALNDLKETLNKVKPMESKE